MHEALAYAGYVADTEIEDVEEAPPPVVSRTRSDGALTMHVYTMGKWHRRTPDLSHTGCGKSIDGQRNPVRREELVGDLCVDCFTGFELARAAASNARDVERAR